MSIDLYGIVGIGVVRVGIGWGGKKLREMLEESERIFRETGHYYGLKDLKLKDEDPIKYERFIARLVAACIAARETVKYIAASPAVREYMELVFGVYTPEGDAIALSTGIMVHVHTLSEFIKWMIRNGYEEDPGIKEGDIFVNNETWAGGVHTADIQTVIPIFYKGQLVGWAGGVTHELEVGAHEHGSMTIFAPERFSEGHHVFAERVGENDKFYKYYINKLKYSSRMPDWMILDEKARLSGCIMIREEIKKIIKEFGIEYYMKAIREAIEDGRRIFINKVKERLVPGRYRGEVHMAVPFKGLPHVHPINNRDFLLYSPIEVIIKENGTIHVSFEGACKWGYHPYNCMPSAMDGGLWISTVQLLAYDGKVNDGAYLAVSQHLPKGSLVNCDYPYAATSITWAFLIPAYAVYGMLLSIGFFARGFLEEVFQPSAGNSLMNFGGITQYGNIGAYSVFEMSANQSGARAVMDGIDAGYAIWNPESDQGNVELYELTGPAIWIGRRFVPNAHGYGMFRGGNGWVSQWLIWKTPLFNASCLGHGVLTGYVKGLFGGYPGPAWFSLVAKNTNISELIHKNIGFPATPEEVMRMLKEGVLKGDISIHKKPIWIDLKQNDVLSIFYTGGSGYGDPINRDPELVCKDVNNGIVSPEIAERVYGVVTYCEGGIWKVAKDATVRRREEIRNQRLKRAIPVREWWKRERRRVLKGEINELIKETFRESMELSEKFAKEFREFWQLPETFKF